MNYNKTLLLMASTLLAMVPGCAWGGNTTATAHDAPIFKSGGDARVVVLERHGESVRGQIGELSCVVLRGTVQERGEAYGVLCGGDVVQLLDKTVVPVVNQQSSDGWNQLSQMVERGFVFSEDALSQMAAFMSGFRSVADEQKRTVKALGRELSVLDLKVLQAFADLASSGRVKFGGCSSFSAWGALADGNEVITGRNLDYTTFPGSLPVLVIAQDPAEAGRQKTIEVSMAGIFGASTAMNEEGVLVLLHDEPGLPSDRQSGWIPRITVLREAIETARAKSAVEDVAQALRGAPVIMGGNVHVSFPVQGSDQLPGVIEWDGNSRDDGVTVRKGGAGGLPAIFCTNDFLQRRPGGSNSNCGRYRSMMDAARRQFERGRAIDVSASAAMMDKAAVRGQTSTYISIIAFPKARRLHVAVAPRSGASATDGEWIEVNWNEIFDL